MKVYDMYWFASLLDDDDDEGSMDHPRSTHHLLQHPWSIHHLLQHPWSIHHLLHHPLSIHHLLHHLCTFKYLRYHLYHHYHPLLPEDPYLTQAYRPLYLCNLFITTISSSANRREHTSVCGHTSSHHDRTARRCGKSASAFTIFRNQQQQINSTCCCCHQIRKFVCHTWAPTLAVKLAWLSYFGDEVLAQCTVLGCRERLGLPIV